MSRVVRTISIQRPIEDVFAVLTNVENTGAWFPGDVEEHWTSPPPHGVGSTRHAIARMYGRRTENDAVATEYDPPHRAAMQGTTPNAPFHVTLDFSREGEGEGEGEATHLVVTAGLTLTGPARLVGPLVSAMYGRAWTRGLANLKRMMESGVL